MRALLEIKDLRIEFKQTKKTDEVVRGLNLKIHEQEILGIVGESGSGKTLTALSITKLLPHAAFVTSGEIIFEGRDMLKLDDEELRKIRGRKISYIFQDPASSLNPVFTIGAQLIETIRLHPEQNNIYKESWEFSRKAISALRDVGMPSPENIIFSYPHQLSGGMKQRVMIAMAILCAPKLLIADEPTTALDVTIQAQIMELLTSLKNKLKFSILLITHDLSLVSGIADKIAVMQLGKIVEYGEPETVYKNPSDPYTKKLLESIPQIARKDKQ